MSRRALLLAVITLFALVVPAAAARSSSTPASATGAVGPTPPVLSSSFVQESVSLDQWSTARWDEELTEMDAIGIRTFILHWTLDEDDNRALYPDPPTWYPRGPDYVTPLLDTSRRHGDTAWLGLANVGAWQSRATDYGWMYNQLYIAEQVADQLHLGFGGRFAGWYIPFEVDDRLLSTPAAASNIRWFFGALANYLHTHDGNLPVMASVSYAGLTLSPSSFATAVAAALGSLDVVAVQDAGGSGYVGPSDIGRWFAALSSALAGTGVALWDDADMFGNGGPMQPSRLQADLGAACPYAGAISGFSFPTQMGPLDLGTSFYYDAYRRYRSSSPPCAAAP